MQEIYLDSAATTRPCRAALDAVTAAAEEYGNPSSTHFKGIAAKRIIDRARAQVATALGCSEERLFFTGSGTEANNQAVIGAARAKKRHSSIIVSTDGEHPSVEMPLRFLEEEGHRVIRLSTKGGKIDPDELRNALTQKVALVSVMRANNETGALYDIAMVRREIDTSGCGALFHCDAVQGFMKTTDRNALVRNCDMVTISAHKVNAFKGCGALYVQNGINLPAYILGGGQERGSRSGTESTPVLAAFGAACAEWTANRDRIEYITGLRDYTENKIEESLGDRVVIHRPAERICGILSILLKGVKSEVALNLLSSEGICVSAGSACSAHKKESRVLTAYGLKKSEIDNALRISFCYTNNREESDMLVALLKRAAGLTDRNRI
ncbi:MAG: cysteine desulfurase [Firmicutes bacterium HGW-Firmicutes-21]|nr:MAG: cysteine desulfurase [Firmicutes bacterium HGW-Firmicutes-21]